ncbi:hypothetical protein H6P81_020197 [Aristolochia fimbriata]|uniref:Heparan-alpha-glucosaminide N-acetyltransferase catalytic domain-containing protein n=1 Tax=Aristolochia fimbriata TaxID=158543 RepID=A0AAV7DTU0_ARIFI|nr:hypothetical protein H6P81_020197 [Aristolochia fimbriata]
MESRVPLLSSSSDHPSPSEFVDVEDEIPPSSTGIHQASSDPIQSSKPNSADQKPRIVSLDIFRGLTIALMILVDDAGGAFPSINHSPWFGVTLADFVMPFFLFIVGVSIALVFKKVPNKSAATKKVIMRTIKLFLLGVLLQGGYFHGRNNLSYGVDIEHIRWLGVLQRISIGYFLAAIAEIWLVKGTLVDTSTAFLKKYYIQWILACLLSSLYLGLLYGLYVPNWEFNLPSMAASGQLDGESRVVQCGVRGSLEPPCNAVGMIDRLILGEKHLYQRPVYRRTKECSVNSPDYGPLPPDSPDWCLAPFDPEGILSSVMAAVTCFIGLQYGHILMNFKSHKQRVLLWSMLSLLLLLFGCVFGLFTIPLSKPLYTLSYLCFTSGLSGFLLIIIYYIADIKQFRKPTVLLQWMGMNALIVYGLAACELFPAAIQGFYWRSPENNLVSATQLSLQSLFHSQKWGTLAFVLLEILFWCLVAGFLHWRGLYIKL